MRRVRGRRRRQGGGLLQLMQYPEPNEGCRAGLARADRPFCCPLQGCVHTVGGLKFGYWPVRNLVIPAALLGDAVDIVGGCKHTDGLHDDDGSGTIQF
jgi:hypothetical protein